MSVWGTQKEVRGRGPSDRGCPAATLPPGTQPRGLGAQESGRGAPERRSASAQAARPAPPLPGLRPPPAPRPLLPVEVGPGRIRRRGTCRTGLARQVPTAWAEGGGPAAGSGKPARAGRLPLRLGCEAPASCVFHLLGNGRGAPAPAQPAGLHPPTWGRGLGHRPLPPGQPRPILSFWASLKGGASGNT